MPRDGFERRGTSTPGVQPFRDHIDSLRDDDSRATLTLAADWADQLSSMAAISVETVLGTDGAVELVPKVIATKTSS